MAPRASRTTERRNLQLIEGERRHTAPDGARLIHHACSNHPESVPLREAHLNDSQRLGVLLQATGLLAHLARGGWHLADGWRDARIGPDGRLMVGELRPGPSSALPQAQLLAMVRSLFGGETVRGRGVARRALRRLVERWQQMLTPIDLDRAVGALLEQAPMLWDEPFGIARQALAAIHQHTDHAEMWVAGPGPARHRLLRRSDDWSKLIAVLGSSEAADVWVGVSAPSRDPRRLVADGRYRKAVEIWDRRTLKNASDLEDYGQALFSLGRFERALEALRGLRRPHARLLRIRCRAELGERGAAVSAVSRLAKRKLDGPTTVRLAEIAVRLATLGGHDEMRKEWVARALVEGRGNWRARAKLVAAMAAYDAGDADAMDPYLSLSPDDLDRPDVVRRWHHARALQARLRGDGMRLVEESRKALAVARRRLPRSTAGRLWSTIVVGYGMIDDLPRAEKAILHSLRLFADCDGPIGANLAWHNLAEVRVRRGRFEGIEAIVAAVLRQNRRSKNARGQVRTLALRVRAALGRGRFEEALDFYRDARRELEGRDLDLAPLDVLAARAYGQKGHPESAARLIAQCGGAVHDLEPEERPALFALANLPEEAERWARTSALDPLWRALLAGRLPSPDAWSALDTLEPYRRARLMTDLEHLASGIVPPERLAYASEVLRECGAGALIERIDDGASSAWAVIDRFIADARDASVPALEKALERTGHGDARVEWTKNADHLLLVEGKGGDALVEMPCMGGRLRVRTVRDSQALRSILQLFVEFFDPACDGASKSHRPAPSTSPRSHGIVGENAVLRRELERIERIADTALPVLIFGESGTGKELAARLVHRSSRRVNGPFIPVNCAALSENLILSELFGHVRGAFTGADRNHLGVFESARGGTVFLDEIGDLPPSAQGSLLRVLQEHEIRRVGETHPRSVDVRIVAATHRDLESMIEDGSFRRDLYYRLKAATVQLPPLRERGADIGRLAAHFLEQIAPGGKRALSEPALLCLRGHDWPGNIRELRNVVEVALTLASSRVIDVEHLNLPDHAPKHAGAVDYHGAVDDRRRELVAEALEAKNGNQAEAARHLGISRQALSYLVRKLDLYDFL